MLLEMISTIVILNTSSSGQGQSLILIGYSSGLPEIAEADELNQSYDLPHNNRLTPDKVLYFGGR